MNYQKSTLENGLRVVTLAQPASRSVTLGLVVEAGSSVERPGEEGLAHLVEHMIFQGSSNRDALEIARLMDGAGGRIGGFTSRDYTCYFAQVLAAYVPYAIDLLGDVVLNPVFPEDALEREKHAILCEYEAGRDNPEQRAHEALRSGLWADHPLGQPILGNPSRLSTMTREDLIYFLHTHYQPDRMIVAAAGSLIHEDFVAQVRDAFWRLLGNRDATPVSRPKSQAAVRIETMPVSQAYFGLGIEAPSFDAADRYHAYLLDQVLGSGVSSRLFVALRERRGLVYHVGSTYEAWRDAGLLTIEGSTSAENVHQAVDLVLAEVRDLVQGVRPITEEELHRAKVRLSSQIQLAGEDTHALMSRLATQELYFGSYLTEEEILRDIQSVDLASLSHWIESRLAPALDSAALAVVGPVSETDESLLSALALQPETPTPHPEASLAGAEENAKENPDGTQAADQEELDRHSEAQRRAGQRDRSEDRREGREDAQGLARRRHRSVRQAVSTASPSAVLEATP